MSTSQAAEIEGDQPDLLRRVLPWVFVGLLALPFHPLWIDFEQVRRGVLLVLTGAAMLLLPSLPEVRGQRTAMIFLAGLLACALVQMAVQWAFHDDNTPWSFQPWLAAYRIAHWFALIVLVRIGAYMHLKSLATAIATLVLITSTFGILQRLGIAEIWGYGVEREPVSTLGNLNVASEWTAIAGIAVAALAKDIKHKLRWLPIAALAMACAYLIINPSRSGKVAMALGLILLLVMRRKQGDFMPLIIAAAGSLFGVIIATLAPSPERTEEALRKEVEQGTKTLDVRFEIARGATRLFGESVIFGKGPGQFAVEYPRHRSQEEIETSSFERKFRTEVRTAHDDWLELLVDGGLIALVLFAAMLFSMQRGARDRTRHIPMFVLLLLMLVRAPIGNAPAAAIAFLMIGSPAQPTVISDLRRRIGLVLSVVLGVTMLFMGLRPIAGNSAMIPYLAAQRSGEAPPKDAAANAIWWMGYEPRWFELEIQDRLIRGDLRGAAHYSERALDLRPFSPPLLLLHGEVLARSSSFGEAISIADQGLELDPKNPELHILKSTALAQLGDVDRAIAAVVMDPHPVVRAGLQTHFAELAKLAARRNETKQKQRYAIESAFAATADLLGTGDPDALELVSEMNRMMDEMTKLLERTDVDTRYLVTAALESLDRGRADRATKYAEIWRLRGVPLQPWQAAILGEHVDRLREVPGWGSLPERKGRDD